MALLPKDQRQQSMLLIVILSIAAAALYYVYVYRPGGVELIEFTEQADDLELQNGMAEAQIGDLQRLRDRLSYAEQQFTLLQKLVPSGAEVPAIYEAIATQTQALNLRLINVEPLQPVDADSAGTLLRQEWQMEVEGEYHAIGTFLARVAAFDRIVRPRITQIVPTEMTPSGRQLVRATFQLETFVLGTPETRPTEGQGGSMNRAGLTASLFLATILVVPTGVQAQETDDRPAEATESSAVDQQTSVDRETFNYPAGTRRDPFEPLSAGDELGPRFEDLNLSGVVYSPATGSIAILMDRATGKRYRVWEGDVIGGAKLVRVRAAEVDFVVTAFGVSRQETLRLKSLDKEQGG